MLEKYTVQVGELQSTQVGTREGSLLTEELRQLEPWGKSPWGRSGRENRSLALFMYPRHHASPSCWLREQPPQESGGPRNWPTLTCMQTHTYIQVYKGRSTCCAAEGNEGTHIWEQPWPLEQTRESMGCMELREKQKETYLMKSQTKLSKNTERHEPYKYRET